MNTRLTRICYAIVALLLGSFAAQAADLPQPSYKAPAYVGPSYANWTGFYVGLNAGYGFGKSSWDFPPGLDLKPKGVVAGGTFGYNFQTGTWVWGIEGDFDYSGMKSSDTAICAPGTCEVKLPWLATGRLRLGYAGWNNWLPYITAGAAYGDVKASTPLGDASKSKIGWTAGAGVEYAMWTNWSVKLEYLYVDLGKFDCGAMCGAVSDNITYKASIVRAGLNYRF
jgi:outer membrane immunogenic protein